MIARTFDHEGDSITYQLTYKKRKSLGIYVDAYGNIELRVPRSTSDEAIENLLMKKWSWVISKHKEARERTRGFKEKTYDDGEHFMYLGVNYPIQIILDETEKKGKVVFEHDTLKLTVKAPDEELMKKLMQRFYKQQCRKLVDERIRRYQPNFKVKPKDFKINGDKRTWGTCNSLREMTFNWKLAMAPPAVIDYIVIHEMCHMVHLNHDRSFWRLVGKLMPNYQEKEAWLQQSHWKMVV